MKDFAEIIKGINSNLYTYDFEKVYDYLNAPRQVGALIHAAETGRPALEGCVRELEQQYGNLHIFEDDTVRQAVGKIVAAILEKYGYKSCGTVPIEIETQWFKNASLYEFQP